MHVGHYLELLVKSEEDLAEAFHKVIDEHGTEPDVAAICGLLASWSLEMKKALEPFAARYKEEEDREPDQLKRSLFDKPRKGAIALIRDLHDLWLMANETMLGAVILRQAADGLRDEALSALCDKIEKVAKRQLSWLLTRMKAAAPQSLIVS